MRNLARPTFIILLIVASTTISLAQSKPDTLKNHLWFSPLRLADLVNPGIELGYEYRYRPNLAIQASAAYMVDPFHTTKFMNFKGYRLSFEQRFFIQHNRYVAFEAIYYNTNFRYDAVFETGRDIEKYVRETYNDQIGVRKGMVMLNLKTGLQKNWGRFILNLDVGIGIKFKHVTHSDRINPADTMFRPRHPNFYRMATDAGKKVTVSLPMNVKIGYSF